jgi:hypothetical protein
MLCAVMLSISSINCDPSPMARMIWTPVGLMSLTLIRCFTFSVCASLKAFRVIGDSITAITAEAPIIATNRFMFCPLLLTNNYVRSDPSRLVFLALNRHGWPNLATLECPSISAAARWQLGNIHGYSTPSMSRSDQRCPHHADASVTARGCLSGMPIDAVRPGSIQLPAHRT